MKKIIARQINNVVSRGCQHAKKQIRQHIIVLSYQIANIGHRISSVQNRIHTNMNETDFQAYGEILYKTAKI